MDKLPPITVIIPLENWDEQPCEEIYADGFLTSDGFAVYLEEDYRDIVFVAVIQSREPNVYICLSPYLSLGKVKKWDEREAVVTAITKRLKNMSAYEFLTRCIVGTGNEIDFRDRIVPGLLNT